MLVLFSEFRQVSLCLVSAGVSLFVLDVSPWGLALWLLPHSSHYLEPLAVPQGQEVTLPLTSSAKLLLCPPHSNSENQVFLSPCHGPAHAKCPACITTSGPYSNQLFRQGWDSEMTVWESLPWHSLAIALSKVLEWCHSSSHPVCGNTEVLIS